MQNRALQIIEGAAGRSLMGSIIHKSDAPTQHWLFFITNNQSCVPVNPEVGRKISYILKYNHL